MLLKMDNHCSCVVVVLIGSSLLFSHLSLRVCACVLVCVQGEGRLRQADRGGWHDDHGTQARPHVRLHLRPVPLQPPAQVRVIPAPSFGHTPSLLVLPLLDTPRPTRSRGAEGHGWKTEHFLKACYFPLVVLRGTVSENGFAEMQWAATFISKEHCTRVFGVYVCVCVCGFGGGGLFSSILWW